MIHKITKKEIPNLLKSGSFWKGNFLPISKHRLYAHYKNPTCGEEDVVLLLAYDNDSLVGYMGVYVDKIGVHQKKQKIGWLSTWWVDPKTKGKGIGRSLLQTMYDSFNGKIGVSQFTPSAKRVYEKSDFFTTLKNSKGYKIVYRSNLSIVLPLVNNRFSIFKPILKSIDSSINFFLDIKLKIHSWFVEKSLLKTLIIEYSNYIDDALFAFVNTKNQNHLIKKEREFYHWLKHYSWVQEAPLLHFTDAQRYQFSMVAKKFAFYFVKIVTNNSIIGFLILQRREDTLKVLFCYTDAPKPVAKILFLHIVKLQIKQVLCYDKEINNELLKIGGYLYKREKIKESIISKAFGEIDTDTLYLNLGDGDCSFA